jgi:hypothetical protein
VGGDRLFDWFRDGDTPSRFANYPTPPMAPDQRPLPLVKPLVLEESCHEVSPASGIAALSM